nr:hypothetical protein [Tanacetum cinerariifolium]
MGIEDIASWDLDNSTWGGWGEVIGTILVICSLAHYGGSGDGYGSLPTDFGVVEGTKKGGNVYEVLGGNRGVQCTVMYSGLNWGRTG